MLNARTERLVDEIRARGVSTPSPESQPTQEELERAAQQQQAQEWHFDRLLQRQSGPRREILLARRDTITVARDVAKVIFNGRRPDFNADALMETIPHVSRKVPFGHTLNYAWLIPTPDLCASTHTPNRTTDLLTSGGEYYIDQQPYKMKGRAMGLKYAVPRFDLRDVDPLTLENALTQTAVLDPDLAVAQERARQEALANVLIERNLV